MKVMITGSDGFLEQKLAKSLTDNPVIAGKEVKELTLADVSR